MAAAVVLDEDDKIEKDSDGSKLLLHEESSNGSEQETNKPESDLINNHADGILSTSDDILSTSDGILSTTDAILSTSDAILSTADGISTSLTPTNNERPVPQLRTSVRVQNKQKREEIRAESEKVEHLTFNTPSSSAKRAERLENDDEDCGHTGSPQPNAKKRRRAWELWSNEDQDIFFEAINDYGKDFDSIQNCLMTKLRRKGTPSYLIKNKDQVRHFYYRIWHKISKHVALMEGVKKSTQEVYSLVNYGELRRKTGGNLDDRKGQKLQELIENGSTSVRVKGKSIRIKTPICRALKKINEIENSPEETEVRMPSSITVEVIAATSQAWYQVQALAHNPRIKLSSPLYRPVSSLLSYLNHKWRHPRLKLRDNLTQRATFPINPPAENEPTLRLKPQSCCDIKIINLKPDKQVKTSSVSLLSHEALLRKRGVEADKGFKRKNLKDQKHSSEDVGSQDDTEGSDYEADIQIINCDYSAPPFSGEVLIPDTNLITVKEEPLGLLSPIRFIEMDNSLEVQIKEEVEAAPSSVLCQLMALENAANSGMESDDDVIYLRENTKLSSSTIHNTSSIGASEEASAVQLQSETSILDPIIDDRAKEFVKKIKLGWTLENVGCLTIGQLYLMFGQGEKIVLEYDFESMNEKKEYINTEKSSSVCNNIIQSSSTKEEDSRMEGSTEVENASTEKVSVDKDQLNSESNESVKNLPNILNHLLNLSKTFFKKSSNEHCLCGQSNTKNSSSSFRSPSANKIMANNARSPSTSRSPRNLSGVSKSVSLKSTLEKSKPPSAKKLMEDLKDQQKVNESENNPNEPKFRVPIAPAPRGISVQQASFNAQISKLLPRLTFKSGRGARKNMVVQRQLPLLSKSSVNNLVAFKVLPPNVPVHNISLNNVQTFIPIASANLQPIGVASQMNHNTSQLDHNASQINHNSSQVNHNSSVNTVTTNLPLVLPSPSDLNTISVQVSGQQLLEVAMPSVNKSANIVTTASFSSELIKDKFIDPVPILKISESCTSENGRMVTQIITTVANTKINEAISVKYILPPSPKCSSQVTDHNQQKDPLPFDPIDETSQIEMNTPVMTPADYSATDFSSILEDEVAVSALLKSDEIHSKSIVTEISTFSNGTNTLPLITSLLNTNSSECSVVSASEASISSTLPLPSESQLPLDQITFSEEPCINIPMLDISLGGTVTFNERRNNIVMPDQLSTFGSETLQANRGPIKSNADVSLSLADSSVNLFDITLGNSNSNSCFTNLLAAVSSQAPDNSLLQTPTRSMLLSSTPRHSSFTLDEFPTLGSALAPPSSPPSNNWLNNEVNDFSLSSLLGNLESPSKNLFYVKPSDPTGLTSCNSSSANVVSMLNENSIDFTNKFAEIKAAQDCNTESFK